MARSLTLHLNETVVLHLDEGDVRLMLTRVDTNVSRNSHANARLTFDAPRDIRIVRESLERRGSKRPRE